MAITDIKGVKCIDKKHRVHSFLADYIIALTCVGGYMPVYKGGIAESFAPKITEIPGSPVPNTAYPSIVIAGSATGKNIGFIPHEMLIAFFVDERKDEPVYYNEMDFPVLNGGGTGAVVDLINGLTQAMFTRYWEIFLPQIVNAYGERKAGKWPMTLQFAAVIRDAMSHGGILSMGKKVPDVSHFGITLSQSDNGKVIMHNILTSADIFLLMLDVDALF